VITLPAKLRYFLEAKSPRYSFWITLCIIFLLFAAGCKSTKLVPDGHYLLVKQKVRSDEHKIGKRELRLVLKQKPNEKFFGFYRFYLSVYNACIEGKKRKFKKWLLENVAEEPVVYDENLGEKTREQLEKYLKNKGYFQAVVEKKEKTRGKKIKVVYHAVAGEPYHVSALKLQVQDDEIRAIIERRIKYSKIVAGGNFDLDNLQLERDRVTTQMRRNGYYDFDKESVLFQADSSFQNHEVEVTMLVKNKETTSLQGDPVTERYKKYRVNSTWIVANYDNQEMLKDKQTYFNHIDTTVLKDGVKLLCKGRPVVNPGVLQNCNFIENGEYYDIADVEKTQMYLSQNRIFRQITIEFKDIKQPDTLSNENLIDCYIYVSHTVKQSYSIDLEGTNTGGDLGAQAKLSYENKNLLRGAEVLNLHLTSSFEQNSVLSKADNSKAFNSRETGIDARIEIPKFLFPFWSPTFSKEYRLRTFIKTGYSFQKIPYYQRPLRSLSFGYISRGNRYLTHYFTPFEINGVQYLYKSDEFKAFMNQKYYYKYSYEDYYISSSSYTVIWHTRDPNSIKDYVYLRYSFESAGNVLYLYSNVMKKEKVDDSYQVFGTRFAQYLKTDFDYRYYFVQGTKMMQVYRFAIGVALPYGNNDVMPNIKKYYAGGSNSMRAWGVRSLGPGSYQTPDSIDIIYAMGDAKIEANIEQRFPIAGILNGALFVDAGNVWSITNADQRDGVQLSRTFYDDIAVGAGAGFRFDFSFFVLRLDMALKARNPALEGSSRWIWNRSNVSFKNDVNVSLGIGYPF